MLQKGRKGTKGQRRSQETLVTRLLQEELGVLEGQGELGAGQGASKQPRNSPAISTSPGLVRATITEN